MSRTKKTLKNFKYAVIWQAAALLVTFFARMVFVRILSVEYLGLNGLFTNILSILSFAELGVGAAIGYSLYKPLAENDIPKIKALMRFYKRAYITIGTIIAIFGMLLTPFLPFIIKDIPDIPYINLIYLMFVANSVVSYFFSYKRTLIIADQKRYITTNYRYGFFITLNFIQMFALMITENYILFLGTQILFTFLENYFVSKKANKLYPYIKTKNQEKLDKETKNTIVRNVKAMMGHKAGGIVVNGTDSILLSLFVGVVTVGLYSNYLLIITALTLIFNLSFQAVVASVGNLGATQAKEKSQTIFKSINLLGFWGFAFVTIGLINLLNPFIMIWLGEEYLFSLSLVFVIVLNFYLTGMRKSVLTFRDAFGLFWYDRYKPIFEASIKIIFSIILGKEYGAVGIFLGTTISTLSTCFWVEPYVLYKYGFKSTVKPYFAKYTYYSFILFVSGSITWLLCNLINGDTMGVFIIKILICIVVPNLIFLIAFYKSAELKHIFTIARSILKR